MTQDDVYTMKRHIIDIIDLTDKDVVDAMKYHLARYEATKDNPNYGINTVVKDKYYIGKLGEIAFRKYLDKHEIAYETNDLDPDDPKGDLTDFIFNGALHDVKCSWEKYKYVNFVQQDRNVYKGDKTNNVYCFIRINTDYKAFIYGKCLPSDMHKTRMTNKSGTPLVKIHVEKLDNIL